MSKVTIAGFTLLPLEDGEEPGMPGYEVTGTVDGDEFKVTIHAEIDGRDVEFENASGAAENWENEEFIFDALCENEEWCAAHAKQAEDFYSQS